MPETPTTSTTSTVADVIKGGWFDRITVFFMFMALIGGGLFFYQRLQPKPYGPLGAYPQQRVGVNSDGKALLPFETFGTETFPTIHLVTGSENLPVFATKCNDSDGPVQVNGESRWQAVDPAGTTLLVSRGNATRGAGCSVFNYLNPIPPNVQDRLKQLHEQGINVTRWKLTGVETPIDPEGNQFVITKPWESDTFVVKYEIV